MSPICAVLDAVEQLAAGLAVAAHQADADLEVLLLGLFAQGEHLARASGPSTRDRLFHEDVEALLDGVGEVHPAEGRRRGEDHHVARLQAVHRLLVAVEADELAVLRARRPCLPCALRQLRRSWRRAGPRKTSAMATSLIGPCLVDEGVAGRAGAAAAAADQGHLDRVVLRAACTCGTATPARAEAAATRPVCFRNSRRDAVGLSRLIGGFSGERKAGGRGCDKKGRPAPNRGHKPWETGIRPNVCLHLFTAWMTGGQAPIILSRRIAADRSGRFGVAATPLADDEPRAA